MDRLDEILKRLERIEKHLGIPDEPLPPQFLRVIQYHELHADLSSAFNASALCGFYDHGNGCRNRLSLRECQKIIDAGNSHVLCPQCHRMFQENYSRDVVRGIYLSLKRDGTHHEHVRRVIDSLPLPPTQPRETYSDSVWFWKSCLMLKDWKPDEPAH